jgi:Glyoxalase-like domain
MSLDHVGAMVRDLAAGAARWEALGFALTPESRQRGKLPARDEEGPWASANRCAVFEQGYLELIGLVDHAAFNPWTRFMDRFEGIHLVALRVANADVAYDELVARGAAVHPPVQRERRVQFEGHEAPMRFRNVFSRDEAHPEARYIVIEHQTPHLLWQANDLSHPNGARGLVSTTVVTSDVRAQADRLHALTGEAGVATAEGAIRFTLSVCGVVDVMSSVSFEATYGERAPVEPAYAAIVVSFRDADRAAALMRQRGITVHERGGKRFVDRAATGGFVMEIV